MLGDAIDVRLALDVEAMELALLARVIGCAGADVDGRLERATLAELGEWTRAVGMLATAEGRV